MLNHLKPNPLGLHYLMSYVYLISTFISLGLHDSVIESVDSFTGFQVFRIVPQGPGRSICDIRQTPLQEEGAFLQALRMHGAHYDFWTEVLPAMLDRN
jgi:hypothetical protein